MMYLAALLCLGTAGAASATQMKSAYDPAATPVSTSASVHTAANPWPSLLSAADQPTATTLAYDDRDRRHDDHWRSRREEMRRAEWRREQARREAERRRAWERHHPHRDHRYR